ncbi:hypothetical protein [Streptomyces sp. NBC_01244]|uniref:hypothetical protein n=1 Tax=Streptomyces sp. NBC_01244 TaxID=2903797 RepID=UPI002E115B8B
MRGGRLRGRTASTCSGTLTPRFLEAGESIVTLARWLGHSSPTITLDHYAHFTPEAGGKGSVAIDALLGTVPEYVPESLVSSQRTLTGLTEA